MIGEKFESQIYPIWLFDKWFNFPWVTFGDDHDDDVQSESFVIAL